MGHFACRLGVPRFLPALPLPRTLSSSSPHLTSPSPPRLPAHPDTFLPLAHSFLGKDVPSTASEFAHPDIIIGLTVLAYRCAPADEWVAGGAGEPYRQ